MVYQVAVLLHLLSAITWVGGTLFIAMVLRPLSRRENDSPAGAAYMLGRAGLQFRPVAWTSIALLVFTGAFLMESRWNVNPVELFTESSRFIHVLQAKVALVVVTIVLSAIHDFRLGPRAMKQLESRIQTGDTSDDAPALPKSMTMLARINAALIVIVVALAVTLSRGSLF